MTKNLSPFDRVTRVVLAVAALLVLTFYHDLSAQVAAVVLACYFLYEASTGFCPLYRALGVHSQKDHLSAEGHWLLGVLGVQMAVAYVWWSAGWEKISGGTFPSMMGKILVSFVKGNPYAWYVSFLNQVAVPNATIFGYVVEWGELAVAVGLVVAAGLLLYGKEKKTKRAGSIIVIAALVGAAFMSLNFYLASGWTSVSTLSLNGLLFWVELVLAYVYLSREVNR